jgi:crotonobetainyl-CoA:carnitine CoA-transferase CaiB-like acyl-CoA transferase
MQGGAMLSVIRLIAGYLERGNPLRTSMPNGVFDTADGQVNVTMVRPGDWAPFCEAIGKPEFATDPRYADPKSRGENLDELYTALRPIFAARATAWFTGRLTARGIMNSHVNSYQQFLREEQVKATSIISWLAQPGLPEPVPMPNIPGLPPLESGTKRAHAPRLGEHTIEVLAEHGFSRAQIDDLLQRQIVGAPEALSRQPA